MTNKSNNIWRKFYECDCHGEGIMMSYENDYDGIPSIDIAFFNHGLKDSRELSFKERIRWCWHILKNGLPFTDMVMINQKEARKLAKDLLKFANKEYKL